MATTLERQGTIRRAAAVWQVCGDANQLAARHRKTGRRIAGHRPVRRFEMHLELGPDMRATVSTPTREDTRAVAESITRLWNSPVPRVVSA